MNTLRTRSVAILMAAVAAGCARHSGDVAGLTIGTPPSFETRVEIPTGTSTHADYFVADFNGDGVLDMAVISLTGELRILIGNGASFEVGQEVQIDGLPLWMSGADFDNDGDEDLAIVRPEAGMTDIWLNDGAGGFTQAGTLAAGTDSLAIAAGDLDGDGNVDVAISRPQAPELTIGFGDGAGGFQGSQDITLPGGGSPFTLAIGDADRDGSNDLIVCDVNESRVLIYSGTQPSNFGTSICELQVPGAPAAATLGDLSGDGLDDLVITAFASDRYVVITDIFPPVVLQGSEGGQNPPQICQYQSFDVVVPARPSLAKVGDVTGDGINDLVACLAFTATLCVVPGTPGGGVGTPEVFDSSGSPLRPFIGDFDQNGKNDVFALSGLGNRVNLWLARDSGDLAGARSYASTLPGASWVEGADFDGDGDFEIVTGSSQNSNLSFMGGADGALMPEGTIDVGFPINQLEAGDIDVDGLVDIVVSVPGGIRVLRNESTPGNYVFTLVPQTLATIGSGDYPFGIEIADFDRDADNDIAICDFVGGAVHIVPGTADAFVFGSEVVIPVGGNPIDLVGADFTGDGLIDIAVSRASNSDIAVLENNENLQFSESLAVPVGVTPNYLVTDDFNSDGRADLVVSNAASGTVTVLFSNGAGFVGTDYPAGSAPTALLAKDLTGDGIVDILVTSLGSGDFRVLVGDGQGSFPLLPSFPGTAGASDAVLQDMTGDGLPELMVSSLITDRVSLVRNIRE